ncbi:AAA family ATPase [Sulfolobus sp. C3]|nr:AAA family ATPase [Sulfolobus sp. C3]
MVCEIPRVTVTTWSSKGVILVGPTYRKYLEKALLVIKNHEVASMVGQPGMGKTTLLKKIEEVSSKEDMPIYLDLANKESIDKEFWTKLNVFSLKNRALSVLSQNKSKFGYSFWKRILGIRFEEWLEKVCGRYDDPYLRIYCMSYDRNLDGMINALRDIKSFVNQRNIILLIDEIRENHLALLHRLINAGLEIPIIMAIPTDIYSKISDLAIRRRIEESRIPLDDALTEDDIKEIIEAYCKELSQDLLPIVLTLWKSKELTTVSSILQFVRNEVDKVEKVCSTDNLECFKEELKRSTSLKNPEEDSKLFEKKVRDLLNNISKVYGITYVHPRGKRIEVSGKSTVIGLFFIIDEQAYIGDVVFTNDGEIHNKDEISLLKDVEEIEHEKKVYKVRAKFLITNSNFGIDGVKVLNIPTLEVVKILNGDVFLLEERIKILFEDFITPNIQGESNNKVIT